MNYHPSLGAEVQPMSSSTLVYVVSHLNCIDAVIKESECEYVSINIDMFLFLYDLFMYYVITKHNSYN